MFIIDVGDKLFYSNYNVFFCIFFPFSFEEKKFCILIITFIYIYIQWPSSWQQQRRQQKWRLFRKIKIPLNWSTIIIVSNTIIIIIIRYEWIRKTKKIIFFHHSKYQCVCVWRPPPWRHMWIWTKKKRFKKIFLIMNSIVMSIFLCCCCCCWFPFVIQLLLNIFVHIINTITVNFLKNMCRQKMDRHTHIHISDKKKFTLIYFFLWSFCQFSLVINPNLTYMCVCVV